MIRQLAKTTGNVFATEQILATLMCATRSVYSWDILVQRVGNKLFFDKRDESGEDNPSFVLLSLLLPLQVTSVCPPRALFGLVFYELQANYVSIFLSISIQPFIHPFTPPSIYPSIHLPIHPPEFDLLTVSETAQEPPQDEGNSINAPHNLGLEATFINHNFSQQVSTNQFDISLAVLATNRPTPLPMTLYSR